MNRTGSELIERYSDVTGRTASAHLIAASAPHRSEPNRWPAEPLETSPWRLVATVSLV